MPAEGLVTAPGQLQHAGSRRPRFARQQQVPCLICAIASAHAAAACWHTVQGRHGQRSQLYSSAMPQAGWNIQAAVHCHLGEADAAACGTA